MTISPLVDVTDLHGLPGAGRLQEAQVVAACDQVRAEAGWHIAPQIAQTVAVESSGGRTLLLPTLHIVEVTDVTVDGKTMNGWRVSSAGTLYRSAGWPQGLIEVSLTHGYEQCPAALWPVIAGRALARLDPTLTQESLGSRSASYGTSQVADHHAAVLGRYAVTPGP